VVVDEAGDEEVELLDEVLEPVVELRVVDFESELEVEVVALLEVVLLPLDEEPVEVEAELEVDESAKTPPLALVEEVEEEALLEFDELPEDELPEEEPSQVSLLLMLV